MKIEQIHPITVTDLWSAVDAEVRAASTLEQASQVLVAALHEKFSESVVLVRQFLTVEFDALPASNQQFVRALADSAGVAAQLNGSTRVLSLIGTHGENPKWCDRSRSEGHVGIPLISAAFVDAIPMISRLLKEIGLPLEWVERLDSETVQKMIGESQGLFFVGDAASATDLQGRHIIAARDFVSERGIKSVFGIGGAYPGDEILVTVAFCRDHFEEPHAEHFMPLTTLFRGATRALVAEARIFAG